MADVDLLVLDGFESAAAHLAGTGFVEVERAGHAWVYREAASNLVVELHRSPTSCPGFFPIDAEGLWRRRRLGAGPVPWRPSPEDMLLGLGLHAAFQHGLGLSLVQYLDFRRLFEREAPDLERVLAAAAAARAEAPLLVALRAARLTVEAPVPDALLEGLAARVRRTRHLAFRRLGLDPERLVAPARPPLARIRWALARGRRLEFLRQTLWSEGATLSWGTTLAAFRRGSRLLRRFGADLARRPAAGPTA
jgi:hypothetical protein